MTKEAVPDFSQIEGVIDRVGSVGAEVAVLGQSMDEAASTPATEAVSNLAEERTPKGVAEQPEYAFSVSHKISGRLITGNFRNKILTPLDHAKVGAYRAQLSGMIPWDALDPTTKAITEQIAHLSVSLVMKPKWAANPAEISDLTLLGKIYEEVAGHEARFRGLDLTGAGGD